MINQVRLLLIVANTQSHLTTVDTELWFGPYQWHFVRIHIGVHILAAVIGVRPEIYCYL